MVSAVKNEFLRLISGNKKIIISPTDGIKTLAGAGDIFEWIDPELADCNEPGFATSKTQVQVHEIVKDAKFIQIFKDLEKSCFGQAQIDTFARDHYCWLRKNGLATFFLFESHKKFFVASVNVSFIGRLAVYMHRFESDFVWSASYRFRVITPYNR